MHVWDFPGHPVVDFTIQGRVVQVQSLVRKLRSHKLCSVAKKKFFFNQNKKTSPLKKKNASNCKCHSTKNKAKYFILNFKVSLASFDILTINVHFDEHGIPYMFTTD